MKKLFFVTLLLGSTVASAVCTTPVDPKKVMVFVDTNTSDLEIDTAEKSACARGERFVVVPKNYKEYTPYRNDVVRAQNALRACARVNPNNCDNQNQAVLTAYQKQQDFVAQNTPINDAIENAMKEIKGSNAKIKSFVISGHDGGGMFGGEKGGSGRSQIGELMAKYPEINDVQSLLLLGCYTGVQQEVMQWKMIFPDVRLIGGYDGSAPLSDRPQGHKYISDLLGKERSLTAQADEKKLTNFVRTNLVGLGNLNAAMYVQCVDGTNKNDYYYASHSRSAGFTKMEIDSCYSNPEIKPLIAEVQKYLSGELEPPTNTASGALRGIYNKARSLEHCLQITNANLDVNAVFNLLFWEGVKKNFANYYKDDLAKAEGILNLDPQQIVQNAEDGFALQEEALRKTQEDIDLLKRDPDAYFTRQETQNARLEQEAVDMLNDPKNSFMKNFVDENGNTKFSADTSALTPEQQTALFSYFSKKSSAQFFKERLPFLRQNSSAMVQSLESSQQMMKQMIDNQKVTVAELKAKPDVLKSFWVPTEKNMANKTRKEIIENLHNMNKVLTLPGLPSEARNALSWVNMVSHTHLNSFQNPFSWHEFTGTTESPQAPLPTLDQMSGGYGMMGGYGGGLVGGSINGQ